MLWLALYLPQLPLESAAADIDPPIPRVIYETRGTRQTVHTLNAAAIDAGIEPGMPLGAARSLCDALHAVERDSDNEAAALNGLALWAQQFTSKVSLQPPDGLILEVGGSLALFSGLENLQRQIVSELNKLGYRSSHAVAPTPAASWLLALNQKSQTVMQHEELNNVLLPLSLGLLPITPDKKMALHNLGLKSIGDCLRLPRDGISRRLGPELLRYLDRALGLLPEPREYYTAPDYFQSQVLLPEPVLQVQPLLFILQRLLRQLCGFLQARGAGAQQLLLGFIMPFLPVEQLQLTLLQPSRDPEHLFRLWQEKLERYKLSAPVEGLELQVKQLLPLESVSLDLLGGRQGADTGFTRVLERLRNRLGDSAIQQPFCIADHRPEQTCKQADFLALHQPLADEQTAHRPLWLLSQPRPLKQSAGTPCLQGPITLLSGPERIESGWWDGGDQRRDYYVARSRQHQMLWVYRDLNAPAQWFLHGFFS